MTRSRYRDDAFAVTPRTRTRQTNAMQVDGQWISNCAAASRTRLPSLPAHAQCGMHGVDAVCAVAWWL
jgi:hypothetical protein